MSAPMLLVRRRTAILALAALLLANCGAGPSGSFVPPSPTAALAPEAPSPSAPATPAEATNPPAPPTVAPTQPSAIAPTTAPTQPAAAPTQPAAPPTGTPAPPAGSIPPATSVPASPATTFGSEVLFLRGGALIALDVATRAERHIAGDVRDFAATRDGAAIALVREVAREYDLWVVRRDGSGLTRLTADGNARIEATPSWAPDGLAIVYASADSSDPYTLRWQEWAAWCVTSAVAVLDVPTGASRTLAAGCDPSISPDGRRIAYAAPPSAPEPGYDSPVPLAVNSVRLINRQGQNGWDFARAMRAEDTAPNGGLLVYGPAWSPDGAQVVYHRFIGVRVETDVVISEIGGSFDGHGAPLAAGAGWLLPARFAPDGRSLVISEHNYGDARGFGGYDSWSARVIRLEGAREVALPWGPMTMLGTEVGGEPLRRAQRAAWSPDGATLAVQLPPGWRPGLPDDEPLDPSGAERPGELWRWRPGAPPEERLTADVDFASPLAWLPPGP
ncbi:MAG TPA: hypothetical protein VNL77_14905 [Roseiflexaceae bacterium]|nr:hypothetical protein [Roseiflexaceae bacterium]